MPQTFDDLSRGVQSLREQIKLEDWGGGGGFAAYDTVDDINPALP